MVGATAIEGRVDMPLAGVHFSINNNVATHRLVRTEPMTNVIEELERLVDDIGALHNKLIVLIGTPGSGKTQLLAKLASNRNTVPMNCGATLGAHLAALSQKQRQLQATSIMREVADKHTKADLLLIDNIEILFDHSLKLDPLGLLKQQAHSKRVVAVWPGELVGTRLTYAEMEHPEHQDYSTEGLVPFKIQ
jgi:predicted ATP-dependent serine protease